MEALKFDPKTLSMSQGGSQNSSKANPATVSRGIQALFSAYRSDNFADPEGFVAQLGVILSEFSDEVVNYVTSPKTGVQRRSKWPPTISEVLDACELHQEYLRKTREQRPINHAQIAPPSALKRAPGSWANVHVPETDPRYARMVEAAKTADEKFWRYAPNSDGEPGLWIALSIWQGGK